MTVSASATSGREKVLKLTPRATDFLAAQRRAARGVERQLRAELGREGFAALYQLLEALGADGDVRMRDYLRHHSHLGGVRYLED